MKEEEQTAKEVSGKNELPVRRSRGEKKHGKTMEKRSFVVIKQMTKLEKVN